MTRPRRRWSASITINALVRVAVIRLAASPMLASAGTETNSVVIAWPTLIAFAVAGRLSPLEANCAESGLAEPRVFHSEYRTPPKSSDAVMPRLSSAGILPSQRKSPRKILEPMKIRTIASAYFR